MYIDCVSDIHLEFWGYADPFIGMGGDVLIIAGDSANSPEDEWHVAEMAAKRWEEVLIVDGNHTHYHTRKRGTTVDGTVAWLRAQCARHRNIHWLDPVSGWQRDRIRILGSASWYDFKAATFGSQALQKERWRRGNNDWRFIQFGATPPEVRAELAARALQVGLGQADADTGVEHVVVVTHTVPRRGAPFNGRFSAPHADTLSGSFVNTHMEAVGGGKLRAWAFGHTHEAVDVVHNGVRYVCNPRGYKDERCAWPPFRYRALRLDTEGWHR